MDTNTTPGKAYQHVQRKLTEQERSALRDSLSTHGLRDPITLDQHGDILDGYNREELCGELGIPTAYRVLEVADPVYWIRHNQTARRNLGEAEMRELIVQTKAQDPQASTRAIAAKLGTSQANVVQALKKAGDLGKSPVKGKDGKTYKPKRIGWATAVADRLGHACPHWQTINNNKARAEELLGYEIPSSFTDPDAARRFAEDYERLVLPKLFPRAAAEVPAVEEPLAASKQQQFDAAMRAAKRKMELEFQDRLSKEIREYLKGYLPELKAREAAADQVLNKHKGFMARDMYRKILACLHPDRVGDDQKGRYTEAFTTFKGLETVLCKPEEKAGRPSTLPKTLEEMLARRKVKW